MSPRQPELPYHGVPPHVAGSDTSAAAAASIQSAAASMRRKILAYIEKCGERGSTDDELEVAFEYRHQTASARRRELELRGCIRKSDQRRETRSGCTAGVYVFVQPEDRVAPTDVEVPAPQALAVIVCGGRAYDDRVAAYAALDAAHPLLVLHGAAPGADTLAGQWCRERGVRVLEVPALWEAQGKSAGPYRNRSMLQLLRTLGDALPYRIGVIAFPGGTGTGNMLNHAHRAELVVWRPATEPRCPWVAEEAVSP